MADKVQQISSREDAHAVTRRRGVYLDLVNCHHQTKNSFHNDDRGSPPCLRHSGCNGKRRLQQPDNCPSLFSQNTFSHCLRTNTSQFSPGNPVRTPGSTKRCISCAFVAYPPRQPEMFRHCAVEMLSHMHSGPMAQDEMLCLNGSECDKCEDGRNLFLSTARRLLLSSPLLLAFV